MPKRLEAAFAALEAFVGPAPDESRALMAAKCRGLLAGYHARWADGEYLPVAVEQVVQSDLWNPETGRRSRSFTVAGKIDVSAVFRDRVVLVDHKTTSEDISDPNAPYWRQLIVEGQPSHYMLLEWLNGRKVDDAVWDVVRKPTISPKQLTKAEARSAAVTHEYFGRRLSDDSILALNVEKPREALEMYEARLAHDCTVARPEWYLQRRSIPRLDAELHEYAVELWEHGQEILHARNTGRHARNSGACMMYGGPCKFLGICSGHDAPDSDNWRRKPCVHTELPGIEGDGRSVLTNSRIRCFQTCRRKHFYDYELGIERQDEEERDALYFGNLWHAALEAWFLAFEKGAIKHDTNSASNSAGSGLAAASASRSEQPSVSGCNQQQG